MNYVVYTAKFGPNGAKHQYTKTIGGEVKQIEFKEYFDAFTKAEAANEVYNSHYKAAYSTFSITEQQYKKYTA